MRLLLFDVDGTLIHSGGAATRAINKAFENINGVQNAMDGIRADGKTDPLILREMYNKHLGRDFMADEAEKIYKEYIIFLREEITKTASFTIINGIENTLESVSEKVDVILGIASGNIEEGAQIKLRHSGLESYFKFGAFGSDSENREVLIRIAIQRGSKLYNEGRNYSEVFVIGDTPMDIIHGQAAGAKVLSVATGSYSLGELRKYNPDYSIENYDDIESVVKILTN